MPNSRRTKVFFAVAVIAGLAALAPRGASAASCAGMSHDVALLSGGTVSPGSGIAGSTFTFIVTYADNAGCTPGSIEVLVEGLGPFPMGYVSGDLATGAAFRAKVALPAGRRGYSFEATSGSGTGLRTARLKKVDPAEVVVSAPSVKPTPRPPKPSPTRPVPTPVPTSVPTPAATSDPTQGPAHTARPSRPPSPGASDPAASVAPAGAPAPARPIRDDEDGPFGGSGSSGLAAPGNSTGRHDPAPLPWLVLLVSSVGAFVGLILFAVLSATLADPSAGQRLALMRGRAVGLPAASDRSQR
jgi:hypothetical protein